MADSDEVMVGASEAACADESVVERIRDTARRTADGAKLHGKEFSRTLNWKEMAGRAEGDDKYRFGDLSRGLLKGARELTVRTKERLQPLEGPSSSASYGATSANRPLDDGDDRPLASEVSDSASGPQSHQPAVLGTVARGAGQVLGATRGLTYGATMGLVKGGIALTDKLYESTSSHVPSTRHE